MREGRRTVALRPGATGFTPPSTPASNPCLNCGNNVQLYYCPECGQRAGDPNPTLREFLHELASEFLNWDGKLGATVAMLFRRPGMLTSEYLAGRRVRYVAPLRLYLTASVIYFFVSAVVPHGQDKDLVQFNQTETHTPSAARPSFSVTIADSTPDKTAVTLTPPTRGKDVLARVSARVSAGAARAAKDHLEFAVRIRSQLATMVFVILPAFAFAVGLVYRRERRHYPQHVVFALHVHTVAFLLFAFAALFDIAGSEAIRQTGLAVGLTTLLAYVVIALRRVYGGTWPRTIAKTATLSFVYLMFFGAGLATLVVYDFATF